MFLLYDSLSNTKISVAGAIVIAKAANKNLQSLQFSENPIRLEEIRKSLTKKAREVVLQNQKINHLDAAAIGIFFEREKMLEKLNLSENPLTGNHANIFHGVDTLFNGIKRCPNVKELQ
jgi:hypothetical protein